MPELKFRAYDKERKRMVYYDTIKKDEVFDEFIVGDPLLYTGRKDMKGIEIYSRDIIVSHVYEDMYVVEWKRAYSDEMWCAVDKKGELYSFYGGIPNSEDIEVVGNLDEDIYLWIMEGK